jgi:hypothetical protein
LGVLTVSIHMKFHEEQTLRNPSNACAQNKPRNLLTPRTAHISEQHSSYFPIKLIFPNQAHISQAT